MKSIVICSLSALCILLNVAHSGADLDEVLLSDGQHKWQATGWDSYSFVVQRQCFCYMEYTREMEILVREGQVVSAHFTDTQEKVAQKMLADLYSIEQWFDVIKDAQERQADRLEVAYDDQFGYPTKIAIDLRKNRADDEQAVIISSVHQL